MSKDRAEGTSRRAGVPTEWGYGARSFAQRLAELGAALERTSERESSAQRARVFESWWAHSLRVRLRDEHEPSLFRVVVAPAAMATGDVSVVTQALRSAVLQATRQYAAQAA